MQLRVKGSKAGPRLTHVYGAALLPTRDDRSGEFVSFTGQQLKFYGKEAAEMDVWELQRAPASDWPKPTT